MVDEALISVLMPVYNAEEYVGVAINSILKQTYTSFEFLIFNDGSSDKSSEIIRTFEDERIKLFDFPENVGYVARLNYGIEIAKGKYIARMDADDISCPERFSEQVNLMENNPQIGVCGAWLRVVEPPSRILKVPENHYEICVNLLINNSFGHPVVMIRRETLIMYNLRYDQSYMPAEDYRLWTNLIQLTKFYNIQKVLLQYRQHANQISNKKRDLQRNNAVKVKIELIGDLMGNLSDREISLYKDIVNRTYSADTVYLMEIYNFVNKIIKTNNIKKKYKTDVFRRKFLNILKSITVAGLPSNKKAALIWIKMYPSKINYQYILYIFYLTALIFRPDNKRIKI